MFKKKLNFFYKKIKTRKVKYFFGSDDVYKIISKDLLKTKENFRNVLELGCGNLESIKKIENLRFENYLAVDWIQPPKKYLKDKRIKFIKSDIDKFKTKSKFNLILLLGTIEHIKYPELILKKIKKMMSKNATLIISHPNYYNIRGIILLTCKMLYNSKVSLSDVHNFYPEEVKEMLNKIGFSKVKIQTIRKEEYNKKDINFLDLKQRLPKFIKSKENIKKFLKKYLIMKKYLKGGYLSGQYTILYVKK